MPNISTEDSLGVVRIAGRQPETFRNQNPLWHPGGSRGLFGGCLIAQSFAAAHQTVAPSFTIHSMHCHFLVSGNATREVIYEVERLRDGKSFATRTVKAKQGERSIFTATVSFTKADLAGKQVLHHAASVLKGLREPLIENQMSVSTDPMILLEPEVWGWEKEPARRTAIWWIRARGSISENAEMDTHLRAVAFMTDNMFIEAIALVHGLTRPWREEVGGKNENQNITVGMMVSLNHSIFFHETTGFRADEWLLVQIESPWSGNERGVVMLKLYTREGVLIATCYQEGVVRLKQDELSKAPSSSRL